MAIKVNANIVAKAAKCQYCGGDVDCFRDLENGKWFARCMGQCGHTGRYAVDWKRALARFRQTERKLA